MTNCGTPKIASVITPPLPDEETLGTPNPCNPKVPVADTVAFPSFPQPPGKASGAQPAVIATDIPVTPRVKSKGICDRFNLFAPLEGATLLGDSSDQCDGEFGELARAESWAMTAFRTIAEGPGFLLRSIMLAFPYAFMGLIFAVLPMRGTDFVSDNLTPLTAALNATGTMSCVFLACVGITMTTNFCKFDKQTLTVLLWVTSCFTPSWVCQFLVVYKLQDSSPASNKEEASKNLNSWRALSFIFSLPGVCILTVGSAKMFEGSWMPKKQTCWCVCGGLTKKVGACLVPPLTLAIFQKLLDEFLKLDTTVLSDNKSMAMQFLRPLSFMLIKKLYYHAYSLSSRLRHSQYTLATTWAASVVLGVANAVVFANTKQWSQLFIFIACNWAAFLCRLWTLYGAVGGKVVGIRTIKWYLTSGKPSPDERMDLRKLRGYEVLAQSGGTSIGLVMISMLYPAVYLMNSQQALPLFKLLFATENTITFVIIAGLNEIIQDVFGKVFVTRRCKCDYSKHFSMIPSKQIVIASLIPFFGVTNLLNLSWLYAVLEKGPFKEVAQ